MKSLNTRKKPRLCGERVELPVFEMVSCPTVRIADVKRRRFDVVGRAQQTAREEIVAQEDKAMFETVSQNEIIRSGLCAHIWSADIIVSDNRFDDEEA